MPARVNTHPTDPIVIADWPDANFQEPAEELRAIHAKARQFVEAHRWPHAYVLYDLTNIELSFSDLVLALTELQSDDAAWLRAYVTPVVVGSPQIIQLIREANAQEQYGGTVETLIATSLDDAYQQIAAHDA